MRHALATRDLTCRLQLQAAVPRPADRRGEPSPSLRVSKLLQRRPSKVFLQGPPLITSAMFRLQSQLLCALHAFSHVPASPLHRFHLSTATASTTPAQFIVEDYLAASCGLTPARALKASKYLSHLRSPANADAVRAFLADVGFAEADIASAIAAYPRILCSRVDKTLAPRIAQLLDMGLSPPQISGILTIAPAIFVSPARISRLVFYLSLLGSYHKVEAAIKWNFSLLSRNIDTVKLNISFLRQCGLTCDDITDLYARRHVGSLLTKNLEHVKEMVACVERLGVSRCSRMFKSALVTVCSQRPERITAKLDLLERVLGYSEAKLAVSSWPCILGLSEVTLGDRVEFLRMGFGLEPSYIAFRPALLAYSLERRLIPRHFVIHVLKAKGLVKRNIDLYTVFSLTHDKFVQKYLDRCR